MWIFILLINFIHSGSLLLFFSFIIQHDVKLLFLLCGLISCVGGCPMFHLKSHQKKQSHPIRSISPTQIQKQNVTSQLVLQ